MVPLLPQKYLSANNYNIDTTLAGQWRIALVTACTAIHTVEAREFSNMQNGSKPCIMSKHLAKKAKQSTYITQNTSLLYTLSVTEIYVPNEAARWK